MPPYFHITQRYLGHSPCVFCLKLFSKACFSLVLNASSCPCGIEASLKGSVSLWWLGFGCKVPAAICATCRRKNPKPCVYVCSKTQLNLEARKQNVTGSLYVAAAPSAMWCGRPPSPAGTNKPHYSSAGMWQIPQQSETRAWLCC